MKKVLWTGLVAGVAMLVGNMILNPILNAVFPALQDAYMNNPAFRPWEDPLMMLFFLYPIVLGFGLAFVWDRTKQLFSGAACKKGVTFGLIYFTVVGLPTFFINFSSFDLPLTMIFSWTLMGFVNGIVAGVVLAKVNR